MDSTAALPPSAIVINRAIGAGLAGAETEDTIRQMVEAYRNAGVSRYFIQRHPQAQPAEMADWLHAAGLEKARGWQKFSRGREAVPEVATDLNSLGNLCSKLGRFAEAEEHLQRSLAIRERALGPDHDSVATTLSNLGNVYWKPGRSAEGPWDP